MTRPLLAATLRSRGDTRDTRGAQLHFSHVWLMNVALSRIECARTQKHFLVHVQREIVDRYKWLDLTKNQFILLQRRVQRNLEVLLSCQEVTRSWNNPSRICNRNTWLLLLQHFQEKYLSERRFIAIILIEHSFAIHENCVSRFSINISVVKFLIHR